MHWFTIAIGAGVCFAIVITLYRVAELRGIHASSVGMARIMLGACILLPLLILMERILRPGMDGMELEKTPESRMSIYMGIAFPVVAAIIACVVGIQFAGRIDWIKWVVLGTIALMGSIMVVCNVEAVAAATREKVNPSFPLAVTSATYLILTFVINVVAFGEMRDGATMYLKEHWARVLGLSMVATAILLMRM